MVFDEKDRNKTSNELTVYFRKDRATWIKMFNSRKEIEYITELKMKSDNVLGASDVLDPNKINEISHKKVCNGFPVNFEDQYLHKYLYKGLIYKLIAK